MTERRCELALLRALGATPRLVSGLVLTEAGLLGLLSALLGVEAGVPLAMVLTWVLNPAYFLSKRRNSSWNVSWRCLI